MNMHKNNVPMIETLGMFFWSFVLIAILAYFGNALAQRVNADIETLSKAMSGNVNASKQLRQVNQ